MGKRTDSKLFWRRLKQLTGFYTDERIEQVHSLGVQRAYFLAAILLPLLAAYQQFVNGQPAAFGVMLAAVLVSAVFLQVRRRQVGKVGDERVTAVTQRSYRWAVVFLYLVLGLYFFWLWRNHFPVRGMHWWPPTIILTILPILFTHARHHTYSPRWWRLQILVGLLVFLVIFLLTFLSLR